MKIRRIEIIGFKSFVDKTVLNFEDGVTAILGPNGCGKSNIIDAIRWGMGEQNAKNLRGQAMEDVIFGGSKQRRPHGMAEVTMTFANQSGVLNSALNAYAEIMITRRLYRNGDSEYLLNKTPCRLKDIAELFMDTGVGARAYSIIEQGKIGMILHARPEERRVLIEEVAGVTKYRVRKRAALSKIEATKKNLIRLNDVISEVKSQLDSLRRQAKKAQRFRELRQQLKVMELDQATRQWLFLDAKVETHENSLRNAALCQVTSAAEVAKLELELEQQRLHHAEAETALTTANNQLFRFDSDVKQVESALALAAQQQENVWTQITQTKEDVQLLAGDDRRRADEIARLQAQQLELITYLEAVAQYYNAAQVKVASVGGEERHLATTLENLRAEVFKKRSEMVRQQGQLDTSTQQLEVLQQRQRRHADELEQLHQHQQDVGQQQFDNTVALELARHNLATAEREIVALRYQAGQFDQQLGVAQKSFATIQQQFHRCVSRLESLQELDASRSGCTDGVKAILDQPGLVNLFSGVVADGLMVQDGYAAAVAAALGDCLQGLCVPRAENVSAAEQVVAPNVRCIYQFVPAGEVDIPGSIDFNAGIAVVDLIETNAKVTPFVRNLLRGCYCVDEIKPFLAQQLPVGVILVTVAGERFDWRGTLLRGVSGHAQQLLQNKRCLVQLRQQVALDEQELTQAQCRADELTAQVAAGQQAVHTLELTQQDYRSRLAELERDQVRIAKEVAQMQMREERLGGETTRWAGEVKELLCHKQGVAAALVASEGEAKTAQLQVDAVAQQWHQHQQLLTAQQHDLQMYQVNMAELQERQKTLVNDLKREQNGLCQQQQRQRQQTGRLNDLEQQRAKLGLARHDDELRIDVLLRNRCQHQQQIPQLQNDVDDGVHAVAELEAAVKLARQQVHEVDDRHAALRLAAQQFCLQRDHVRLTIVEKYQIDIAQSDKVAGVDNVGVADGEADAEENSTTGVVATQLVRLRTALDGFGEVNLMAIEEYAALEQRFNFLIAQRTDLNNSVDDLQSAINQINRTSSQRFKEAFELVNAQFKEVFPRLFVGGDAELKLTDSSDLLESGVEIVAQPPGKKLQNISLLSGGEKALTAVALIFAMFLIKPSPFCVLDEVDAPLDDANIGRFNEMVKQMSAASQFVVITHNPRTMEIADTLFGVTMEDPGVSSLVSVRLGDIISAA